MMKTFNEWLNLVARFTLPQIRCDVKPTPELLAAIDQWGDLGTWEQFAGRLERKIVREHWVWPEKREIGS